MPEGRIVVDAYAGYRGEESPRSFLLDRERIEVREILSQWIEEDEKGSRKRFFRVKGSNKNTYLLFYDENEMIWYVRT